MNEEDSEQIGICLEGMGLERVPDAAAADVVMLNTCSVRAKPEEKVWSVLGRLREIKAGKPGMIVGVCGCMAQVESEEIRRRAPHVDLIVGTANIAAIPDLIRRSRESARHGRAAGDSLTALQLPPRRGAVVTDIPLRSVVRAPKLKAHVPIMYGCDKFCTFCIVPLTRGRERSRPTSEILAEIEGLAARGTVEVALLGQTVNSYGKNLAEGRVPFCDLLARIDRIPGIRRTRFTSPYPRDFTDELIDAIGRLETVCEHVHLPLQVADDYLLADMHRGYTVVRYREILDALRARVPGVAVTTDIMLGYPGETDEQFRRTLRFVERARFDSAFMFAYSPRPGTKAAAREDQVPRYVKIERLQELVELQNRITVEVNEAQVGQTFEVLVEGSSPKDPTQLTGLTRTNKTVNFPDRGGAPNALTGKFVRVRAVQGRLWGFRGELVD